MIKELSLINNASLNNHDSATKIARKDLRQKKFKCRSVILHGSYLVTLAKGFLRDNNIVNCHTQSFNMNLHIPFPSFLLTDIKLPGLESSSYSYGEGANIYRMRGWGSTIHVGDFSLDLVTLPKCFLRKNRGHSLSSYAKLPEKVTCAYVYVTSTCAYHRLRNVSFSENFA